jgi:integrase
VQRKAATRQRTEQKRIVERAALIGSPHHSQLRPREYLTVPEVEKLMKAAKDGRYGHRDVTMILIAFRHGLRAIEICGLEWSQVAAMLRCTFVEPRTASPPFIPFAGMSCGHCASYNATPDPASLLNPTTSAARRLRVSGSPPWQSSRTQSRKSVAT